MRCPQALHYAAQGGHDELVAAVLDAKSVDIQATTQQGFTALYLAAKGNHVGVVQLLLAHGADPNARDGHGQTALHRACEDSLEETAEVLIANVKTDVNAVDLMERTPLHWACSRGPARMVTMLLDRDAQLIKTKGGETALHWATRSGLEDIVSVLLKHFPFINVYDRNERGESAVDLAAESPSLQALLVAHADSLGYSDSTGTSIRNQVQAATTVKPLAPSHAKGKKITIKMKPPSAEK
jgi:ankyrin repeat protein